LAKPGSRGLSTEDWRYIHYANGDEELCDSVADRYEWTNLPARPEHHARLKELQAIAPKHFAAKVALEDESLPNLKWRLIQDGTACAPKPDGNPFDVVFTNRSKSAVILHGMAPSRKPKPFRGIEPGRRKRQQTRTGAVWLITDESNKPLGYFIVGDRTSRAVIPRRIKD
jgi:hypothetical protein